MKSLPVKDFLLLFVFFLSLNESANSQESEASFWANYLNGNYEKAAEAGKTLGEVMPEYFFLAAICYQNVFKYREYDILKNRYLQSTQDFSALKNLLEQKEAQNPDNFQIYLLLGITKRFLPEIQLKDARSYLEKSIALNKSNPYAYNCLSMIAIEERNLTDAIRHAKKAINLKPDFPEPYNNLAVAYDRHGMRDKAVDALIECFKKSPISLTATFENLINMTGEPAPSTISPGGQLQKVMAPFIKDEKIRNKLKKTLESRPQHYLALEEAFLERNSIPEVTRFLEEFECPEELKSDYIYIKARYAFLTGDSDEFDRLVQSLISGGFSDYRRLFFIGYLYAGMSRVEEAIQIYDYALQHVDPFDKDYALKLTSNTGAFYLEKKDYERAKIWLEKALAISPHDLISLGNLAKVYLAENRIAQAKNLLLQARKYVSNEDERSKQNIKYFLDRIDLREFRDAIASGKEFDVNQANERGITPLMLAAASGMFITAKSFLEKGADVNARALGDRVVVEIPWAKQFKIEPEILGETAIQIAAANGNAEIVRLLLENNADISDGLALYEAAEKGFTEIAAMLLNRGADVNVAITKSGSNMPTTALIAAAENGHTDIVKLLIDHGAEVNATRLDWTKFTENTALSLAKRNGHQEIINLLEQAGAKEEVGQAAPKFTPHSKGLKASSGGPYFVNYDIAPEPKGGFAAIQRNLKYPEEARRDKIRGRVIVHILISEEGNVEETKILKSLRPDCDEAAIQAIKKTEWKPARKNGKPVKVWVGIPVIFKF